MQAVFELLQELANRGIKLSVEGDNLNCYAQKGVLTGTIKDRIAQNKPKIIEVLRSSDNVQTGKAPLDAGNGTERIQKQVGNSEKSKVFLPGPSVDLGAEAVLDPGIQPPAARDEGADFTPPRRIFLTGASGFLGAYLLHDLLAATEASLYCLVRCRAESEGHERLKNNLLKYSLWNEGFASRIIPVPGDLAQPHLGLPAETFDSLCNDMDAIYHNGAMVNFIYPYTFLKDSNVRGTQQVIRLACGGKRKPLHFISTVGVFPPAAAPNTTVFESDFPENWQQLNDGYRQSKWVAEKIVTMAASRGLPVRIYRPGFVTGDSTTGICNTDDFLPRMIKGCIQLGIAPDSDANIEMVPVDYVSKTIVHLSLRRQLQPSVFHIVSPHPVPAKALGGIAGSLGYDIEVVPYPDWRNALLKDARTSSKNALFPLLTMFTDAPPFEQVPTFDCRDTLEGLRGTQLACPELNQDLMATYLAYFKKAGFLET